MSNWKGYLIKGVKTKKEFPSKYIALDSYRSTPNQREEIKAYRDDNTRNLTRVTAKGTKSAFAFATREHISLDEKMAIQKFFTDCQVTEEEKLQRKVELEYWNDEENKYKTGYFYIPNMIFPIYSITDKNIFYKSLTFEFIEY